MPAHPEIDLARCETDLAKLETDRVRSEIDIARFEIDIARFEIDIARFEIDIAICGISLAKSEINIAKCKVLSRRVLGRSLVVNLRREVLSEAVLSAKPKSRRLFFVGRRVAVGLPSGVGLCT